MQKKPILFVLIGLGALIVLVAAGFGIKYAIDAMQPHRQPLVVAADKNKQTYNSSGVAANPSDTKGAWVKLAQDWRVGLDQGALVNYALASDGTRAFLSISSFSSSSKSELRAYDGATGKLVWQVPFAGDTYGYPVAGNGVVVQADNQGHYIAFDGATGKELWRQNVDSPFVDRLGTPGVFLGDVFYYAQGSNGKIKDTVTGVDARTGAVRHSHVTQSNYLGFQSLRVAGDHLILGTNKGTIFALRQDFSVLWQHDFPANASSVPHDTYAFGNVVIATNQLADKRVEFWAFDATTGKQLWNEVKPYAIHPAVVGGVLAVVGDVPEWKVTGYELTTGKQLWVSPAIPRGTFGRDSMGVADGTLFTVSHHVEIINPTDGSITYRREMPLGTSTPPVSAGGHIVSAYADAVYGFN